MSIAERFALRRATAARWTLVNPVLAEGEEGYETDTGKRKVGDGVTAWAGLPYQGAGVVPFDPTGLSHITHTNVQQAIQDLAGYADYLYYSTDRPIDQNLCGQSVREPSGSSALTSGTRYFVRVKCLDSRTLSKVYINVAVAGSGLTSGQNLIGVMNAAGTLIGTCPDQTTAWASTGSPAAALTVVSGQSLAVAAGQFVYVQFLSVGTTPPAIGRGNNFGWGNAGIAAAPYRFNTGLTGQTALATSVTLSGLTASSASWAVSVS